MNKPLQHRWLSEDPDHLAGQWINDSGVTLCEWHWISESKTLCVAIDGIEQSTTFDLDDHLVQFERLKEVLPDISRHRAQRERQTGNKR